MVFINSPSTNPYFNLALEEYVFTNMNDNEKYLIFWQNDNAIIIGKYQNTIEEINQEYVDAHSIKVARRLSGGGAVYHDSGNLNYTFIVGQSEYEAFNFSAFVKPILAVLKTLNIKADINGRNDITINGLKFSGSSQYYKRNRLLHHGCIMLNSNLNIVTEALKVNRLKIESKSIYSVRSRVTNINEYVHNKISMQQFKSLLFNTISQENEIKRYNLTENDYKAINDLMRDKYSTWEWNYGKSPKCSLKREMKFPAGTVTCYLNLDGLQINEIHFYGDFFGKGDISELEQQMVGLYLNQELEHKLDKLNIGYYMNNFSSHNIYNLLKNN